MNKLPNESWMSSLPDKLVQSPIILLSIPGSHNSLSYTISPTSTVSPDSPSTVRYLSRLFPKLVNPIIYKWSLNQSYDVTQQLKRGIRYLDIRLVSNKDQLRVAHGLYGSQLYPLLQEIQTFLDDHKQEVVILDFQHFYDFKKNDHLKLVDQLVEVFGDKLCRNNKDISSISLQTMRENNEQVVVIYRFDEMSRPFLWPSSAWPTPWPNTMVIKDLIKFLDNELNYRQQDIGLVSQCLLTVNVAYVMKHLNSSIFPLAVKTNATILPWLSLQNPRKINVVIIDFVNDEFVEKVLHLNDIKLDA